MSQWFKVIPLLFKQVLRVCQPVVTSSLQPLYTLAYKGFILFYANLVNRFTQGLGNREFIKCYLPVCLRNSLPD